MVHFNFDVQFRENAHIAAFSAHVKSKEQCSDLKTSAWSLPTNPFLQSLHNLCIITCLIV